MTGRIGLVSKSSPQFADYGFSSRNWELHNLLYVSFFLIEISPLVEYEAVFFNM